jgi:ubiquinone/menaquinone biosynthesis C-methylase UbiE
MFELNPSFKKIKLKYIQLFYIKKAKAICQIYQPWLKTQSTALDVGCGDGLISQKLKIQFNIKLTGCDVCNYLLYDIPFSIMTNEAKLPFPDHHFDTVIFTDVLHHTSTSNQIKLLNEAVRVTKKNILIYEVQPTINAYIADYILNKISNPWISITLTFKNIKKWREIFKTIPVKISLIQIPETKYALFNHFLIRLQKIKSS